MEGRKLESPTCLETSTETPHLSMPWEPTLGEPYQGHLARKRAGQPAETTTALRNLILFCRAEDCGLGPLQAKPISGLSPEPQCQEEGQTQPACAWGMGSTGVGVRVSGPRIRLQRFDSVSQTPHGASDWTSLCFSFSVILTYRVVSPGPAPPPLCHP